MRIVTAIAAVIAQLVALPNAERRQVLDALTPQEQLNLYLGTRYEWPLWAREKQMPPPEPWSYWFLPAGRGGGKTRPAAQQVIEWAKTPETRIALVGRDAGMGRKVMVDGESGILANSPPWFRPRYLPSLKRLVWPNGSIGELHSANEPDTLRGPQYHKAWLEELFHWKIPPKLKEPIAWSEGIRYCLRLGDNPQAVITSTPRSTQFCHDLLLGPKDEHTGERPIQQLSPGDPNRYDADGYPWSWTHVVDIKVDGEPRQIRTFVVRWPTEENAPNLSAGKPEEWRKEFGASRIGQQELDGAILAKSKGALWSTDGINDHAVDGIPVTIIKTRVAVDPTRADAPIDEAGIIVGGLGIDGHVYVWDDCTKGGSPATWGKAAVQAKNNHRADAIVCEKNRLEYSTKQTIRAIDPTVKWIEVTATDGKRTRAEPVSAMYDAGKVHHVRDPRDPSRLARLEDEMISWDPRLRMPSPNRMDALVWLVWDLLGLDEHVKKEIRLL